MAALNQLNVVRPETEKVEAEGHETLLAIFDNRLVLRILKQTNCFVR